MAAHDPADDTAELARMAERLAAAEAELSRVKAESLAAISHQIRTPLNGVLALAELLSKQPLAGDGLAYVRTIRDSVDGVVGVLSEAIDLHRAECVGLDLAPAAVALQPLMDEVQGLWLARAQQVGVSLNVSFEGADDAAALLDAGRLKQVFGALVSNALRFTRRGGVEAGLRAVLDGDRLRLRGAVRDTGPTIAPDKLAAIFEPFVQDARGERTGETGLGLSISRQIMAAMGGRIWAESNPGAGTNFIFEFDAPVAAAPSDAAQDEGAAGLRAHVLIVDDNATNRMVAETLCEMFGCTSESAEDGFEAVEAARLGRFDAILMDIKMPRMDGVEATRAIRAMKGAPAETPIIALTANADATDAEAYVQAGMFCVVEKPIKADRLLTALNEALAQPLAARRAVAAA